MCLYDPTPRPRPAADEGTKALYGKEEAHGKNSQFSQWSDNLFNLSSLILNCTAVLS